MSPPDPLSADPGSSEVVPPLAVACVRALMERHGLPKYRQSAWLADAIGLSYSQAHRRMTGASPWTLEDVAKVAALFGESLADVVNAAQPGTSVAGVMSIGSTQVPCRLWLGDAVDRRSAASTVVAVKTSAGWSAVAASEATDEVVYKIEKIEARPVAATRKVVAVLDDDQDLTNSICAHLDASGYDARPFYKIADLFASVAAQATTATSSTGSSAKRAAQADRSASREGSEVADRRAHRAGDGRSRRRGGHRRGGEALRPHLQRKAGADVDS